MRTFYLDRPRSLSLVRPRDTGQDRLPSRGDGSASRSADPFPHGLDDLLFGCSTVMLVVVALGLAVGAFVH